DCPHSGAADTIDGLGSDGPVETDAESNLASRILAGPTLQDMSEDHVLDRIPGDARALDAGVQRPLSELHRRQWRQSSTKLSERRSRATDQHAALAHLIHILVATRQQNRRPISFSPAGRLAMTSSIQPSI